MIERTVSRRLAELFGLQEEFSGGVTQPGGSSSNTAALLIARDTFFPAIKTHGYKDLKLVIFTSVDSHYSVTKAAIICGLGAANVCKIRTDVGGRMVLSDLKSAICKAQSEGKTPFFVNATAGTTVRGAFDPLEEIADVCANHNLWMHVDGSWGGSFIFSAAHNHKLRGVERADSITINPHKMLKVPVTCSFLLGADMRRFHSANAIEAGYLFHDDPDQALVELPWDLADMTAQCGRRGDSLKLAMSWIYYGSDEYAEWIDDAMEAATFLSRLVSESDAFELVGQHPPPCLQVCFYYNGNEGLFEKAEVNSRVTRRISALLVAEGFMVDYAPGDFGEFLRVVVHVQISRDTVDDLFQSIKRCGERAVLEEFS